MKLDMPLQLAQVAPTDGGGGFPLNTLFFFGAAFLLMYALLIHPQRKQQKEHQQMLQAIEKGDSVVTSGGIHGKVTGIADDVITVEIAERVRVKLNKSAISARHVTKANGESKS